MKKTELVVGQTASDATSVTTKKVNSAKTVNVIDEAGNRYEATYLNRARGLVKHGRARFIGDNTICLAYQPNNSNEISEDNFMTHTDDINANVTVDAETSEVIESTAPEQTIAKEASSRCNLDYILEQIEQITAHRGGQRIESVAYDIANSNDPETATAALEAVRCMETTNQQLISFYLRIVDELNQRSC